MWCAVEPFSAPTPTLSPAAEATLAARQTLQIQWEGRRALRRREALVLARRAVGFVGGRLAAAVEEPVHLEARAVVWRGEEA